MIKYQHQVDEGTKLQRSISISLAGPNELRESYILKISCAEDALKI